ncbi:MAG: methionyl-tRNA formyltransferase [Planctomycetota bacterium]|nr:MAG: methionyl-tRNA formyltransferase [Planctomycetota bacterium]
MRFAFLGSPPFAVASFAAAIEAGLEVVGLVTAPPRQAGRGRKQAPNPLVDLAVAKGIPVLRPESARDPEFQTEFQSWQVDLGVVVSYGQILNETMLQLPKLGCVNLHGSLLPRWRGASPIQAAILAGDSETGVSLQKVVLALDAGAVLTEAKVSLCGTEEAPALTEQLAELGARFLVETLQQYDADGALPAGVLQDESLVTSCKKIKKSDGVLDWSESAVAIERRVRAMSGWPCGQTWLPDGDGLRVHSGRIPPQENLLHSAQPGTILCLEEGIAVACGEGSFRIDVLQREGKARMEAKVFLQGARLQVGQSLKKESHE